MKWPYSIKYKITAATIIAAILLITLLTNLFNRNKFNQLGESFASLYEDRLLAQTYIFNIYKNLHTKEIHLIENLNWNTELVLQSKNERDQIIDQFEQTYLTEEEAIDFENLKIKLDKLYHLETQLIQYYTDSVKSAEIVSQVKKEIKSSMITLDQLSQIQEKEGKALTAESHKIVIGSYSVSQLEIAIIIVLALIVQVLIFTSKSLISKTQQNANLN